VNDRDRLKKIRALRDRLDRLPASPQRDRILRDLQRRAVDIEGGIQTTASRLPAPEPPNAIPTSRVRNQPPATAKAETRAPTVVPAAAPIREGVVLWLDDDEADTDPAGRPPWARGLRSN
jgi:hypothetical protein